MLREGLGWGANLLYVRVLSPSLTYNAVLLSTLVAVINVTTLVVLELPHVCYIAS